MLMIHCPTPLNATQATEGTQTPFHLLHHEGLLGKGMTEKPVLYPQIAMGSQSLASCTLHWDGPMQSIRAAAPSVTFLYALGVWILDTAENLPTFKKAVMVQPYTLSLSKFTPKQDFNCYVQTNTSLLSLSSCFVSTV